MAPFCQRGQLVTQTPSYQHSSGYKIIGDLPFSGLGISMSITQCSIQLLQPVQTLSSNTTGLLGVTMLGNIRISSLAMFNSLPQNGLCSFSPCPRDNLRLAHPS